MVLTEAVAGVEETLHILQTDAVPSHVALDAEDPAVSSLAVKSESTLSAVSMPLTPTRPTWTPSYSIWS